MQMLSADHSCKETVARVNAERLARGLRAASPDTSAYCQAGSRLPESLVKDAAIRLGLRVEANADFSWLWKGRKVKIIDGTTVTMADSVETRLVFPQNSTQKADCGFPIARLVVVLSLATGALLDMAVGPYEGKGTGEHALLRDLLGSFARGDVVLGDAYFASYFLLAMLKERGVDAVFHAHGARKIDMRKGVRIGHRDHIVKWRKPQRPSWMSNDFHKSLPDELSMRETQVLVECPGFRTKLVTIATTILSSREANCEELASVYRERWHAELDLRHIKQTLQMDHIRAKSPAMARKEMWAHLAAYNSIRQLMLSAAKQARTHVRRLSFKAAVQTLAAYKNLWLFGANIDRCSALAALLDAIARHRVGHRPNRIEPREVKRRPKPYEKLRVPRRMARDRLLRKR